MPAVDEVVKEYASPATSKTILVIARDAAWREACARGLGNSTTLCLTADSGKEGLRFWEEFSPACIVLEDRLPDMETLEFLHRIADPELGLGCAVVVLAPELDEQDAAAFFEQGVQDYLVLDASLAAFLPRAVQNALRRFKPILKGRSPSLAGLQDAELEQAAEEALRASEERFRSVFADAATSLIIKDLSSPGMYANRAFTEMTGYSLRELASLSVVDITHPEDRPATLDAIRQLREGSRASVVVEKRYVRSDGSTIWARTSVSGVRDNSGKVRQIIAVIEDITEQKRGEAALRENAGRFQELAQSIHQVFWFLSVNPYRALYVSPAFEGMWGIPAQALYDDPFAWVQCIHPEDRDGARAKFEAWLQQPSGPAADEFRIVRPDGSVRWLSYRGSTTVGPDGALRASGITEDITEAKRAELRLRRSQDRLQCLTSSNIVGIIVGDAEGVLAEANDAFLRMVGYDRDDLAAKRINWRNMTPPEWDGADRAAFEEAVATGSGGPYEKELIRKDGSRVPVLLGIARMPGGEEAVCFVHDLTERKRVIQALERNERRFRALIENSFDYVSLFDRNGTRLYASPSQLRLTGYQTHEREGRSIFEHIHPEDLERAESTFRDLIARPGDSVRVEVRARRKNGDWIWVESIITNLLAEPGVEAVVTNTRDITERKRIVQALEHRERHFRALIENGSDLITLMDENGKTRYASPATLRTLGYQPDDLQDAYAFSRIHPDDVERAQSALRELLASPGVSTKIELRTRRSDGIWLWVESIATNLLAEPGVEAIVINSRDITERKLAAQWVLEGNQRLNALIQAAPVGICELDPEGRLMRWNPAATQMFGWNEGEVLGKLPPFIPEEALNDFKNLLSGCFNGQQLEGLEQSRRCKDGSCIEIGIWTAPLRDASGRTTGLVAIMVDVTERKQLEGKLQESDKLRAIGRLAGGIAHDFNNLLTVILGYAKLLKEQLSADHPLQKHARAIHDSGERAAALIEQLLAFSRQKALQPKILDWNTVLEHSAGMFKRLIGEDVQLEMLLAPGGVSIQADPSQLDQLGLNLVVNARDAMPEGGSITLETSVVDLGAAEAARLSLRSGRYAALSVADTGHGMDEQTKARIFEPFFTTKGQGRGTGLGLSTVYGIVQQSGGGIAVHSKPGFGTTFTVYLPSVDEPDEGFEDLEPPSSLDAGDCSGSGKILLVEDEAPLRELVGTTLQQAGYTVLEAADGQEALGMREELGALDLLLTDVVMPGMNGPDLAQRLRLEWPELPVIYVSGYNDRVREDQLNADTVLIPKPFSLRALLDKVNELLLRRASDRRPS
jgi:two-component system, cell cycle sensor histidine kinase and response regulator CckA